MCTLSKIGDKERELEEALFLECGVLGFSGWVRSLPALYSITARVSGTPENPSYMDRVVLFHIFPELCSAYLLCSAYKIP